jgi:hypothetical protein
MRHGSVVHGIHWGGPTILAAALCPRRRFWLFSRKLSLAAAARASIQYAQQVKGDASHDFQMEDDSHLWNHLQDDQST